MRKHKEKKLIKLAHLFAALILTLSILVPSFVEVGQAVWSPANAVAADKNSDQNNDSYNLADKKWITNIEVDQISHDSSGNQELTKVTDLSKPLKDGSNVAVILNYKIPKESLKGNGSKITYQMPDGFKIDKEQSGEIDGKSPSDPKTGTYKITTDGYIEITFNKNFEPDSDFFGTLKVDGTLQNNSATDNREIKFDGTETTIIVENSGDVEVKKSSKVAEDKESINYTIDLSTKNGTPGTVDVIDEIKNQDATNVKGSYDEDSFKIVKKSADNKTTELSIKDYKPVISTNSSKNPTFKISDLPRLEKGESYEITYKVKLSEQTSTDGYEKLGNIAKGKSGGKSGDDKIDTEIKKRIEKSGYYSADDGKIHWTINVNEAEGDLSDYQLIDNLPNNLSLQDDVKIQDTTDYNDKHDLSSIIVKGKKGDTAIKLDFSKLPDKDALKKHKFQITFETNALEVSETKKITNTADFQNEHHHYSAHGDAYVSPKGTAGGGDNCGISKTWNSESSISGNDAERLYNWSTTLNLSGQELDKLDYSDVIEDPYFWGTWKDAQKPQYHYAVASELYKELTDPDRQELVIGQGAGKKVYQLGKDYEIKLHFYKDKDKKEEVDKSDSQTKVKSFSLEIVAKDGKTIKPTKFTIHYSTHIRVDEIKANEIWAFKNKGTFDSFNGAKVDKSSEAEHEETSITKGVSSTYGDSVQNYDHDDKTFDLTTSNGKVWYQVLLQLPKEQDAPIEITDILPKGMSYVDKSLTVAYLKDMYNYVEGSVRNITTTTEKQADGTTKLKITLSVKGLKAGQMIALRYQASVSDDQSWQDPTQFSKTYINKVSWNGQSDEQKTTFKDEKSLIKKSAEQLKDSDGKLINTVRYRVDINTNSKDLNPSGDTVLLTDKLSDTQDAEMSLDLNSIKLYKYDPKAKDNLGSEIDPSVYTFKYDDATHEIKLELPDRLACVFVYQYDFDAGKKSSASISNTASLAGRTSSSVDSKLVNSHSAASGYTRNISIYKVDSDNYTKLLANAQFAVKEWNKDKWNEVPAADIANKNYRNSEGKLVTNSQGKLNLTSFDANKVYCVNETKAPDGYSINNKNYYIVWLSDDANANDVYKGLSDTVKNEIGKQSNIHFFKTSGGAIYVPDEYSQLTVNKHWVNSDGTAAKPGASSVKVDLYRVTKKLNAVKVKVVLYNPNFGLYQNNDKDNKPFFDRTYSIEKGSTITIHGADNKDNAVKLQWVFFNRTVSYPDNNQPNLDPNATSYTSPQLNSDTTIVAKESSGCWTTDVRIDKEDPQPIVDQTTKTKVETVTLDASNNWQKTWNNLPHEDENGNTYYYYVEEEAVLGYKTSYRNNNGVKYGQIDVINQEKNEFYHLPQSGGRGLYALLVLGTAIVASGLAFRRKKFN
ncbi:MAG: Cna B-type domain-containing protein [Lactobacillus equicursoris]|uniref:Cna B-type domain-containing protein n=1 Tax=Lactobacillus equicursoris TaxID=420645 RepID=UPI00243024AE|nr:Cna B-type domain-containing protein [Lactobacillus equicursoris]MDD6407097.1 Cna B-type domain-containing protein [Lactobacillus equicursoris]